jgi:predicted nucleic acid-binding protein
MPDEEKSRIFAVLQSLPFLPLDYMLSQAGGRIYGDKRHSGSRIDSEDAMIAGIARVNGKKLLTRSLKHFQGIEGVSVEPYRHQYGVLCPMILHIRVNVAEDAVHPLST